tara:strand:+ start:74 stop:277 length:204 start_codon:yes stop_codon:yes gene_type:complete
MAKISESLLTKDYTEWRGNKTLQVLKTFGEYMNEKYMFNSAELNSLSEHHAFDHIAQYFVKDDKGKL